MIYAISWLTMAVNISQLMFYVNKEEIKNETDN